jgi:hypothetical protein
MIRIKEISVGFNLTANMVSFQVLTFDLSPIEFKLVAKFYFDNNEVANVPFQLPIEDYNNWKSDSGLENKCLVALNLEKV